MCKKELKEVQARAIIGKKKFLISSENKSFATSDFHPLYSIDKFATLCNISQNSSILPKYI